LINQILPAIREKFPAARGIVRIQQDNAGPHILPTDEAFVAASSLDGWNIQLTCQPPNSPDMNVLDLGYFNALQSLQYQKPAKTIDELIANVNESWDQMPNETINKVFLSLQACMIEVMKHGGGNRYKLPHIGKDKLSRQGQLPLRLECPLEIKQRAQELNAQ